MIEDCFLVSMDRVRLETGTYSAVGDTEESEEHVVVASGHELTDHRLCILPPGQSVRGGHM